MTEFADSVYGERPQDVEQIVRVSAFGRDAIPVPYVKNQDVEGEDRYQDVRHYVAAAGLLPTGVFSRKKTYTLDGRTVSLDAKVTSPGAVIVVTNRVRNG